MEVFPDKGRFLNSEKPIVIVPGGAKPDQRMEKDVVETGRDHQGDVRAWSHKVGQIHPFVDPSQAGSLQSPSGFVTQPSRLGLRESALPQPRVQNRVGTLPFLPLFRELQPRRNLTVVPLAATTVPKSGLEVGSSLTAATSMVTLADERAVPVSLATV